MDENPYKSPEQGGEAGSAARPAADNRFASFGCLLIIMSPGLILLGMLIVKVIRAVFSP